MDNSYYHCYYPLQRGYVIVGGSICQITILIQKCFERFFTIV